MPVRATKRGAERTPLSGDWDVLICGASFAGLAVARELRAVLAGRRTRAEALARYAAFCDGHRRPFAWLLRVQHLVSRVNPTPLMTPVLRALDHQRFVDWSFGHYLRITPPEFALAAPEGTMRGPAVVPAPA